MPGTVQESKRDKQWRGKICTATLCHHSQGATKAGTGALDRDGLTHGLAPVRVGFHDTELRSFPRDTPLLKTLPAVHWPTLRWPERNRGLLATLRAHRRGFRPPRTLTTHHLVPLCLTGFASLGLVLETFVCVKELFARGENEL